MLNTWTRRFLHCRSVALSIILLAVVTGDGKAQIRETAFGQIRRLATQEPFDHVIRFPGRERHSNGFVLWNNSSTRLVIARVDSLFSALTAEVHYLRSPVDDINVADVNGDSHPDLLILDKSDRTLGVILDLSAYTLEFTSLTQLPFIPTSWRIADVNNDGRVDMLFIDRNNPGIVPLVGNGKGKFTLGKTIVPDLPVGAFVTARLNDDNLIDIVAYDWVKSELHMLFGVGRGRFIDQGTYPVQGEVSEILATRTDPQSVLDLLLVVKQPSQIQLWQQNEFGDFRPTKQSPLNSSPSAFDLGDVDADRLVDFAYLDHSPSLQIVLNEGDTWSEDRLHYSAGADPVSLMLHDFNRDGKTDCLILDRQGSSLLFYFNAEQDNTLHESLEFVTPNHPAGISICNARSDKRNDLALVTTGGRTFSVFAARKHGGLLGETPYALSLGPKLLTYHSKTDSSARFVLTSAGGDSLIFFSMNFKDSSSSYAVIPAEGSAELISTGVDPIGQADFFTFNTSLGPESPAIHYYQRLNPGTFIEQSFRLTKPDVLLGATAGYLSGGVYPDLAYIYRNTDSGYVDLVVAYGDSLMTYAQRHFSIDLPATSSQTAYVWTGSFAHKDTTDLLLYFSEPSNSLSMSRGRGNEQFDEPVTLVRNVRLESRSMLQIVDADNDGNSDIVFHDKASSALGWLKGKADGTFEAWRPLLKSYDGGFFAVGDLNGDGIADVAVSLKEKGTIKIYNGIMLFKREGDESEK